jgi:hypothetical protein
MEFSQARKESIKRKNEHENGTKAAGKSPFYCSLKSLTYTLIKLKTNMREREKI